MNEEYIDASLIVTVEWIDKNLAWETGRITIDQASNSDKTSSEVTSDSKGNSTETKKKPDEVETNQVNINSIRAEKNQVWIPEIEILNRVNDFSHIDEKNRPVKITSNGKVRYTRAYRMRAMLSSSISFYPYDVQVRLFLDDF